MNKLLLGSDPEMFTMDQNGNLSSVSGKLGCSKWEKLTKGDIRFQEDNVLIEFDIDPFDNFVGFNDAIVRGLKEAENLLKPHGLVVAPNICSHIYSAEEIESFGEGVLVFGCEPDFNGLDGSKNRKPKAKDAGLRSAGGHIHFGFDSDVVVDQESQMFMTMMCDYFLGLPSVLLDPDNRRRELYGKAGAIRYKSYGIEYRTLSNFWIFDEEKRRWAWDQANKAYNAMKDRNKALELANTVDPYMVQRIINSGDKEMANNIIKQLNIM